MNIVPQNLCTGTQCLSTANLFAWTTCPSLSAANECCLLPTHASLCWDLAESLLYNSLCVCSPSLFPCLFIKLFFTQRSVILGSLSCWKEQVVLLPARGSSNSCSSTPVCLAGCAHRYSEVPDSLHGSYWSGVITWQMAQMFLLQSLGQQMCVSSQIPSKVHGISEDTKTTLLLSKIGNHCSSFGNNIDAISTVVLSGLSQLINIQYAENT